MLVFPVWDFRWKKYLCNVCICHCIFSVLFWISVCSRYCTRLEFTRGTLPQTPIEGPLAPGPCTPPHGWVYILLGCKVFMGYKHGSKQRPLNQEDNQAPQPTLWCDNQSAIKLAKHPIQHQHRKHIELHIHFIRKIIHDQVIEVLFFPTKDQVVDIFTKSLTKENFFKLWSMLGV